MTPAFSLVLGYHPDTPVPQDVRSARLGSRFAIVFDPYFADGGRPQLDLLCALLDAVASSFFWTGLQIELRPESIEYASGVTVQSIRGFRQHANKAGEEDWEPPPRIRFSNGQDIVCLEESEFWNECGGPFPYSDSYTMSFYTRRVMAKEFQAACERVCDQLGAEITATIEADLIPPPK